MHTIEQARQVELVNRVVLSTDSDDISRIAVEAGVEVPFIRPSQLARDDTPKLQVLIHAVKYLEENHNYFPDIVIDLDPTSPLRTLGDIESAITLLTEDLENCDSVITGYRSNKNPYFNMVEINNGGFACLSKAPEGMIAGRQQAPMVFAMNASIYVWKTDVLLNQTTSVVSGRVKLYEMPENRSIDIDSEVDFDFAELLFEKGVNQ